MTLTEQLKKGELEQGYYYMQIPTGDIRIITECMKVDCEGFSVLSKVPSYEEYSRLEWYAGCGPDRIVELNKENRQLRKWCEEFNALEVAKENQQLKELLKEAKDIIEWYKGDSGYKDIPTETVLAKIDNAIGENK